MRRQAKGCSGSGPSTQWNSGRIDATSGRAGAAAAGLGSDLLLANEVLDVGRLRALVDGVPDARVTVAVDSPETMMDPANLVQFLKGLSDIALANQFIVATSHRAVVREFTHDSVHIDLGVSR